MCPANNNKPSSSGELAASQSKYFLTVKDVPSSRCRAETFGCTLSCSMHPGEAQSFAITLEASGLLSTSQLCRIELDAHDIMFNGGATGPFSSADQRWQVVGTLMLLERDGVVAPNRLQNRNSPPIGPSPTSAAPPPLPLSPPTTVVSDSSPAMTGPSSSQAAVTQPIPPSMPADDTSSALPRSSMQSTATASVPSSVARELQRMEFPPLVAARIFARPVAAQLPGGSRQHSLPSRLAALVLVPQRDPGLTDDDLETRIDTFSVTLGHSLVMTVAENAAVRCALWRPEMAAELNTAGQHLGTSERSDKGTQTGDLAQLLSDHNVAWSESPAATATLAALRERIENAHAFRQAKAAISEAHKRESAALAEVTKLKQALAATTRDLEQMKRKRQAVGRSRDHASYHNSRDGLDDVSAWQQRMNDVRGVGSTSPVRAWEELSAAIRAASPPQNPQRKRKTPKSVPGLWSPASVHRGDGVDELHVAFSHLVNKRAKSSRAQSLSPPWSASPPSPQSGDDDDVEL